VAGGNKRSSFLFGLTLTELAFILFFLLLFISISTIKEKTEEIKEKTEEIDKSREKAKAYEKLFEEIPEYNEKTDEEKVEWLKELVEKNNLNTKYQELIEKHKSLNDFYKNIVQSIPVLKDKTGAEKSKLLKELVEKSKLGAKNQALNQELAKINEKVKKLEKEKKGRGGNRHPACWKNDKTKKPEYIYNIILRKNGVTTHRGYEKYLEREFQKIPGSQNIIGTKDLSIREFKQKTRSVFKWSQNAKPECRHFVRIFDETPSHNKFAYKIPLKGIEHYFFKKEEDQTYLQYQNSLASPSNRIIRDTKNKTGVSSSRRSCQQFSKKNCISCDRKSMPRSHIKICVGLERDGLLRKKSKSKPDDSSKGNGTSSSLIKQLEKIEKMGNILQTP
jgi:hypothetical protein